MSLSISNDSSMIRLLNQLNMLETQQSVTMTRLSTGKRINRGADDPAGLIALSSMQADLTAVNAASDNANRAKSMLDVADGALGQISSLVSDIQSLALASVGDSATAAEKAANQSQIDSALESIDRIVNQTKFNGKQMFGGANQISVSVSNPAALADVHVYGRNPNQSSVSLSVAVTAVASAATSKGTSLVSMATALSAQTVISVAGKDGTASISLGSGSTKTQILAAINAQKGVTGVSAVASSNQLVLYSTDTGADAFVSISTVSGGDSDWVSGANIAAQYGTDATVTVNGQAASTSGTEVFYSANGLSFSANLAQNQTGTYTVTVSGGGATFQLGTRSTDRTTLGLDALTTAVLGRSDLGYLADLRSGGSASIMSDPNAAAQIARQASTQVATANARIGGFVKYGVEPTINSLGTTKEALSSAVSDLADTDIAFETSRLQRQNMMINAAISMLGVVNSDRNNILSLLR